VAAPPPAPNVSAPLPAAASAAWQNYLAGATAKETLASAAVAHITIEEVVADDAIKKKIRDKHPPLTVETVRQALIYAKDRLRSRVSWWPGRLR
jgi:hypothetical protein